MSQKISGKNLHYDTTLPPFLARLRGQAADSDGPDPLLVRNRRHAAPRSGSREAEDAPLVVDEGGNVVEGLRVGADGVVTETDVDKHKEDGIGEGEEGGGEDGGEGVKEREKAVLKEKEEKMVAIGAGKKRKVGKVVGAADGEEERTGSSKKREKKDGEGEGKAAQSGKKKKAKKIKLSFGDDDG
ncbi:hypothetical protein GE09DRAFT_1067062 [Coniochaeta sp. 2T2.1]|nr:hypothetical protein GE09DRAFT_1067062 [Coniochaeta sp. 2T2.1]